ncbi:hypothetical protein [Nonomuraea sp. NPDC005501]|uniref:hypothetical protein n=1 Tax=Nonomuraea sp. NPDC005501 TaxID=3156884 RepID=UPI0033A14128
MNDDRSPCRMLLSVVVGLIVLLAACGEPKERLYRDDQAFAEFALSALSVAHPDYSFNPAPDSERTSSGLAVTLKAQAIGSFMAGSVGAVTVSVAYDAKTGVTTVTQLPETRLGRVLKTLSTSKDNVEHSQDTRELLSNMGASVEAVAVAELAEPVTDALLDRNVGLSQPQRVLLSLRRGEPPLGNSLYCGRTCDGRSYVAPFAEWVSTLRSQDQPALKAFGLDLKSLTAVSHRGLIYGLIYEKYDAATLLAISKNPMVRSLYVVDASLKCASDSSALCDPVKE